MTIGQAQGVSLQPAWLLHYQDFRETSFIVDLFTLQHGRVAVVARGARAARPATRALYQPFRPLLLSWVGEGDLFTLTGIEPSGAPLQYANASLACAYYLNELVVRLLDKGNVQPELFAHYAQALAGLASGPSLEAPLRLFELQLLDALGVLPDLAACVDSGQPVVAGEHYRYYPALAQAEPADPDAGDASFVRALSDGQTRETGVPVSGDTLLALSRWSLDSGSVLDEARPLMKRIVRVQLGDRPLNSRAMFATLAPADPRKIERGDD